MGGKQARDLQTTAREQSRQDKRQDREALTEQIQSLSETLGDNFPFALNLLGGTGLGLNSYNRPSSSVGRPTNTFTPGSGNLQGYRTGGGFGGLSTSGGGTQYYSANFGYY